MAQHAELVATLRDLQLSSADFYVMSQLSHCHMPERQLISRAHRFSGRVDLGKCRREETASSVATLLRRKLVTIVTGRFLRTIARSLQESTDLGPIDELPAIGDVDFTYKGARVWESLEPSFRPSRDEACLLASVARLKSSFVACIGTTWEYAHGLLIVQRPSPAGRVSSLSSVRVGAWRSRWWRTPYPEGVIVSGFLTD